MTYEQIEEIAQTAAEMYGQVWRALPMYSKDIWREEVRHADLDIIQARNDVYRCAAKAKKLWLEKQAEPEEAKPVEKKSKNKK